MIKRPEVYVTMLGSTLISSLTDRKERPALRIGSDVWSRHEVATKLGIVNTLACRNLSKICVALGIRNTRHLYESTSPYTFADQHCGVTTLYAMFAAFRDRGLTVEHWYRKTHGGQQTTARLHQTEGQPAIVSFLRFKQRELDAERRTKESEKKRKGHERQTAHRDNVHQFKKSKAS